MQEFKKLRKCIEVTKQNDEEENLLKCNEKFMNKIKENQENTTNLQMEINRLEKLVEMKDKQIKCLKVVLIIDYL